MLYLAEERGNIPAVCSPGDDYENGYIDLGYFVSMFDDIVWEQYSKDARAQRNNALKYRPWDDAQMDFFARAKARRRWAKKMHFNDWLAKSGPIHLLDSIAAGEHDLHTYCMAHSLNPRQVYRYLRDNELLADYAEALSIHADSLVSGSLRIVRQTHETPIALQNCSMAVGTMMNAAKWYQGKANSFSSFLAREGSLLQAPAIHITVAHNKMDPTQIAVLQSPPETLDEPHYLTIDHEQREAEPIDPTA